MNNIIILLSSLIITFGCASSKKIATPLVFNTATGLNNIMRGTAEGTVFKTLGKPEFIEREWEETENLKYFNYYSKGIQISVQDNKVLCMFLFYKSKRFEKYSGINDIYHQTQTIEGVKSIFGKPDYFSQSIVSGYGEFLGQQETFISYDTPEISFTFWNGELGDIRYTRNEKVDP